MNTSSRSTLRTVQVAIRATALLTLMLGVLYAAAVTGVGQLVMPARADGSLVSDGSGQAAGSSLIGQSFIDVVGEPLPQYFQSRPSAAEDGYDAGASSGSNLGPENEELVGAVAERRRQVARFNGVPESEVPADAVTASASGLDPDISPGYAALQIERVATARGRPVTEVQALVAAHTEDRLLGYLGEPSVNVVELNLALDALAL